MRNFAGSNRMRFLLDTHAFLWWLAGDTRLGAHAADVTARAIAKGVLSAGALDGVPAYRDRRGG